MICETCGKAIRDDAAFCPHCGARVPGGPTYDDYAYEAFISYRHLERDTKIATRLQRSLEGYRLPRGIARADDGATRLGKLFRDQDELPTSQSLGDQIEGALKRSRRLVVICTPQTNESQWVQREVELYASFHGRDAIVIALAACLATAWMISRRNPMVDRFTLAPKTVDEPYLDYSLNYDEQEARSAFLDILKYLDICELSKGLSNRIAVCAEEIMNSLIGLKTQEGMSCRHFFDVRMMEIMDDAGSQSRGIQFFLKARGKSFNPVRELSLNPESMMTGNALSLLLVNKLCDDIDYNYRNGVNCVTMKFFKS